MIPSFRIDHVIECTLKIASRLISKPDILPVGNGSIDEWPGLQHANRVKSRLELWRFCSEVDISYQSCQTTFSNLACSSVSSMMGLRDGETAQSTLTLLSSAYSLLN